MSPLCFAIVTFILTHITVTGHCHPACVVPDSLSFGPVRVGGSAVDTIRLANQGVTDLMVDFVSMSTPAFHLGPSAYTGSAVWLAPDSALAFPIRFAPDDTGQARDRLEIRTDVGTLAAPLAGEGVREVIVIDEIHADPAAGTAGDANGDGERHTSADEFVELLNVSLRPARIGGWQLSDAGSSESKRFTFPEGTWLGPGERVVLFGGGSPSGIPSSTFVDDGKIGGGLSNSGDTVYLIDPMIPDTMATARYGSEAAEDESICRHPEGRGPFARHGELPGSGERYSPGRARAVLESLAVLPSDTTVAMGSAISFRSLGVFGDGTARDLTDAVVWAVSQPGVSIDRGQLVAPGPGTLAVQALTDWGHFASAGLHITGPQPVGISLSPADTIVAVGDTLCLSATSVYPDTHVAMAPEEVAWSVSDTSLLALLGHGSVRAMDPGVGAVSARSGTHLDSSVITVGRFGDLNADGAIGLTDAIRTIHLILADDPDARAHEYRLADVIPDGVVDIFDLVEIINRIIGLPPVGRKTAATGAGAWQLEGTILSVAAPVALRCLAFDVRSDDLVTGPLDRAGLEVACHRRPTGQVRCLVYSLAEGGIDMTEGPLRIRLGSTSSEGRITVERVVGAGLAGESVPFADHGEVPASAFLSQNNPNPFNTTTSIRFRIDNSAQVRLRVLSALGQEVAVLVNGVLAPGEHRVSWNGKNAHDRNVGSGVYIVLLEASGLSRGIKMVLLR